MALLLLSQNVLIVPFETKLKTIEEFLLEMEKLGAAAMKYNPQNKKANLENL